MANFLSKVKLGGVTYDLKDATARADIAKVVEDLKKYQPLITSDAKLDATLVSTSATGLQATDVNGALKELKDALSGASEAGQVTVEKLEEADAECLVLSNASTANALTAVSATASAPKFTGTAENIKATGASFKKQVATATFTGTEEADAIVTGASISYDKASIDGTKITATTDGLTVGDINVAAKTINAPAKA